MTVANWPRLTVVSVIAAGVAIVLGAQALSIVLTRAAPETAAAIFGANGMAKEQLAFQQFTSGVINPEQPQAAARNAYSMALAAVRSDPLAPKAHTILALSAPDEASQKAVLKAAVRLNRRELSLQGLALQRSLADKNYPAMIETLDQILRAHPEYSLQFFPILAKALAEERTIPLFAQLLDNSSPWHARFLDEVVGQPEYLANLAILRPNIAIESENFDNRLIAGLAGQGDVSSAERLYQQITGKRSGIRGSGLLDWSSAYPPFDWQLTDEAGFRAQPSPDGSHLELSVRPGKGGVIASRLLRTPVRPFEIKVGHRNFPPEQMRDVSVQLSCGGQTATFYQMRFSRSEGRFQVRPPDKDCPYMLFAINARAWSGRSALSGTIERISLQML